MICEKLGKRDVMELHSVIKLFSVMLACLINILFVTNMLTPLLKITPFYRKATKGLEKLSVFDKKRDVSYKDKKTTVTASILRKGEGGFKEIKKAIERKVPKASNLQEIGILKSGEALDFPWGGDVLSVVPPEILYCVDKDGMKLLIQDPRAIGDSTLERWIAEEASLRTGIILMILIIVWTTTLVLLST